MSLLSKLSHYAVAALVTATLAACAPVVVTTDNAAPESAQQAAPTTTQRPSNANLVNAFDFYGQAGDRPGYFFTSPSGAWRCAITPHEQAGCQSTKTATQLAITGVPATVTAADGTEVTPNALVVDSTGDAHFAKLGTEDLKPTSGPAQTLQFGQVLAAAGFRCNVQDLGISCISEDSKQGFTFSSDGYTPSYTDVPVAP
jgi:hypothetical protein